MSLIRKIKKAIFGYDLFISYSRKDSLDYAYSIAEYFMAEEKNYECYIDQIASTTPGKQISNNIITAIKRSRGFILIGSKGAQQSQDADPIPQEIDVFLTHNTKRFLIPININGALDVKRVLEHEFSSLGGKNMGANSDNSATSIESKIYGLPLIDEKYESFEAKQASEDVLNKIEQALKFTKKSIKLRNIAICTVLVVMAVTALALGYSIIQVRNANEAIEIANIKADSANKQAIIAVTRSADAQKRESIAVNETRNQTRIAERSKQDAQQATSLKRKAELQAEQARKEAASALSDARQQNQIAMQNKKMAAYYSKVGDARNLANQSKTYKDSDPDKALLFSLLSMRHFSDTSADEIVESNFREILAKSSSSGPKVYPLSGHEDYITALGASSDGEFIASGDAIGQFKIWRRLSKQENHKLLWNIKNGGPCGFIAFSPSKKIFVTAGSTGNSTNIGAVKNYKVWDIEPSMKYPSLIFEGECVSLNVSGDGNLIAIASGYNTVDIYNFDSLENRRLVNHLEGGVSGSQSKYGEPENFVRLEFGGEAKFFAAGTNKGNCFVWSLEKTNAVPFKVIKTGHTYNGHGRNPELNDLSPSVDILRFDRTNSSLLTGSTEWFHSSANGDYQLKLWSLQKDNYDCRIFENGSRPVDAFIINNNIIGINDGGQINTWSIKNGEKKNSKEYSKTYVEAASVSADGQHIVLAASEGNLLWFENSSEGYKMTGQNSNSKYAVNKLRIVADLAICGSIDNSLKVYSLRSASGIVRTLGDNISSIQDCAVSQNGKILAYLYRNSFAIWNIEKQKEERFIGNIQLDSNALRVNNFPIQQINVSPDGSYFVVQGEKEKISYLYRVTDSLSKIATLKVRTDPMNLKYSPDSRYLVSEEDDSTWLYYLEKSHNPAKRFLLGDASKKFWQFTFSPNSKWLAAGLYNNSKEHSGELWNLTQTPKTPTSLPIDGFTEKIGGIVFSPRSDMVVLSEDGSPLERRDKYLVKIIALKEKAVVASESFIENFHINFVKFSDNQRWLLMSNNDILSERLRVNTKLWNLQNGFEADNFEILPNDQLYLREANFSPNDSLLLTMEENQERFKLWDISGDKVKLKCELVGPYVSLNHHWESIFSPHSDKLIVYAWDFPTPFVFDLDQANIQQSIRSLQNGEIPISSARFSEDGIVVYVTNSSYSGRESTFNRFRLDGSVTRPVTLIHSDDQISKVITSNDFKTGLAIGDRATFWNFELRDLLNSAKSNAGRNLTWDEWTTSGLTGEYFKVIDSLPPHFTVFNQMLNYCTQHYTSGDTASSIRILYFLNKEAVKTEDPELCNDIAWATARMKQPKLALETSNRSITLDPFNGNFRDTRGVILTYLGLGNQAIIDFEAFIEWVDNGNGKKQDAVQRQGWVDKLKQKQFPFTKVDDPFIEN